MAINKVIELDLEKEGIIELLKGEEVEQFLKETAEEIVRDVRTISDSDEYEAVPHYVRKSRTVYNIISTSDHAVAREAKYGHLARAARKRRG